MRVVQLCIMIPPQTLVYCLESIVNIQLPHPPLRLFFELWSPPSQRRSFVHNVSHAPQHALLIRLLADIVVRTNDVEFVLLHLLHHEVCDLLRGPRTIGFLRLLTWVVAALKYLLALNHPSHM